MKWWQLTSQRVCPTVTALTEERRRVKVQNWTIASVQPAIIRFSGCWSHKVSAGFIWSAYSVRNNNISNLVIWPRRTRTVTIGEYEMMTDLDKVYHQATSVTFSHLSEPKVTEWPYSYLSWSQLDNFDELNLCTAWARPWARAPSLIYYDVWTVSYTWL